MLFLTFYPAIKVGYMLFLFTCIIYAAVVKYSQFAKVQLKGLRCVCAYTPGKVAPAVTATPLALIRYNVLFQWDRDTILQIKSENHILLHKLRSDFYNSCSHKAT